MQLSGKVAIVTGGTAGIGKAIVKRFCEEGASVIFVGRNGEKGKELESELKEKGYDAIFSPCDVSDTLNVDCVIKKTWNEHGKIDVLVNCAGIIVNGTIEEVDLYDWEEIFRVNVTAPYYLSREVVPLMRKGGGGSIINIASTAGLVGAPTLHAYSATKGALIQLTMSMAASYAKDNIRVNALCPGATATEMLDEIDQEFLERIPMGRAGTTEEVAGAAVFLASKDSGFVTGATLLSDGGFTAV